jgi:small conductance mechanosensitive channel
MEKILNENVINTLIIYGKNITFALLIIFIGKIIARKLVNILTNSLHKKELEKTLVIFIGNILYGLIIAFLVIAALGQLGIETTSLAAIIAAIGLAIGLSLQGSLSNIASGIMIIFFRPFKIDDFIEAGGTSGTVEEVGIFTTTLRTPDNKVIILPNAIITSGTITNYSIKPTRRLDMVFSCGYEDDIKKAKEIIEKTVKADKRVLKEPALTVGVLELADSSINFAVRPWVKKGDYFDVKLELNEKIKLAFDKNNISIPFPQRDVHLKSNEK